LSYGLTERHMSIYVKRAMRSRASDVSEVLLRIIESRLDNFVFRMGFAPSRSVARALISHGHFLVNGRRVTIPSQLLRPGDEVVVREQSRVKKGVSDLVLAQKKHTLPSWVSVDWDKWCGTVKDLPLFADLDLTINVPLIIEFYAR
jgi:small subunit ribosomal protein S4